MENGIVPSASSETSHLESWTDIVEKLRDNGIKDVHLLNKYTPFSSETYGELHPPFVEDIIRKTQLSKDSIFVDLGSGIGNVVLQLAYQVGCKCIGVEIRKELHDIAIDMHKSLLQKIDDIQMVSHGVSISREPNRRCSVLFFFLSHTRISLLPFEFLFSF